MIAKTKRLSISYGPQVEVWLNNENSQYSILFINGPLGTYKLFLEQSVNVQLFKKSRIVQFKAFTPHGRALCGTYSTILLRVIRGLEYPFEKFIELRGLGLRLAVSAGRLELDLGFSHLVKFSPPDGVTVEQVGTKNRVIRVRSTSWSLLSQIASVIKMLRPGNVYSEKGVYEKYEIVDCREGKKKKFS